MGDIKFSQPTKETTMRPISQDMMNQITEQGWNIPSTSRQDAIRDTKERTARVESKGGKVTNPTKAPKVIEVVEDFGREENEKPKFQMKADWKPPVIESKAKMAAFKVKK